MTEQQRIRILVLTEDVQNATRAHEKAERALSKAVAELNEYLYSLVGEENQP